VLDVDSMLSPQTIGKTHSSDAIVNRYNVSYRFKDSIINASSIWFLGQADNPVTITMPPGIDVVNISGMNNVTENNTDHAEISGFFKGITKERGEITLYLSRNTSYSIARMNASNVTSSALEENATENTTVNVTKPVKEIASKIRDASIAIAGIVIIILIFVFKVKRR
jgi:ABC-type Na+ efflux pump permease subunit